MLKTATFLILWCAIANSDNTLHACSPNSRVVVNGKSCQCNNQGQWTDANCHESTRSTDRKLDCQPGQIVFEGCNRCICQNDGSLSCSEQDCSKQQYLNARQSLAATLAWCSPFKVYYINCNICVCPASGKTMNASCAIDVSCNKHKDMPTSYASSKMSSCIPKVMYLFPCMQCLCTDNGSMFLDNCVETCAKKEVLEVTRRCIPRTLYRKDCNVCRCPDNSYPDDKLCTTSLCSKNYTFSNIYQLTSSPFNCTPNQFTKPRCIYCDCNHDGIVDKRNCLVLPCLKSEDIQYSIFRETCNPGEMVPFCTECLCSSNGISNAKYCSKVCSNQGKLKVLEKAISENPAFLVDKASLRSFTENDTCEPNSVHYTQGKHCLCPEHGKIDSNLCSVKNNQVNNNNKTDDKKINGIDINVPCEAGTLVEFDCNTCFCGKNGKIDPKWCTNDDCEAKKIVQELYRARPNIMLSSLEINKTCTPGTISKIDCNFCICPENGYIDMNSCTKNDCATVGNVNISYDKLVCEPLSYYEVDCNICFCPHDGLKNVAKCTKNHCEKGFLRSDGCVPGHLFNDGCNVCICPPNGNKGEKACTNFTCSDEAPWKKIFQLSETILGNQIVEDATRNLDLCFPGEEFVNGCKFCVCPEMGLRYYAICSSSSCEDEHTPSRNTPDISGGSNPVVLRKLNTRREICQDVNVTGIAQKKFPCTAGSMYIIRCQQCICPYAGDIMKFCRPLPFDFYCEQAFPGINFSPMRRDGADGNLTKVPSKEVQADKTHLHSRYECKQEGKIVDSCFICECEKNVLILEHCFKSNSTDCQTKRPTFLSTNN